jgi:hypothetical protein
MQSFTQMPDKRLTIERFLKKGIQIPTGKGTIVHDITTVIVEKNIVGGYHQKIDIAN